MYEEKFDYIDAAEYQYKELLKILRKEKFNSQEIEDILNAVDFSDIYERKMVEYFLKQGSGGYGYSCAFRRALRKDWQVLPFSVCDEDKQRLKDIAELSLDDYLMGCNKKDNKLI